MGRKVISPVAEPHAGCEWVVSLLEHIQQLLVRNIGGVIFDCHRLYFPAFINLSATEFMQ